MDEPTDPTNRIFGDRVQREMWELLRSQLPAAAPPKDDIAPFVSEWARRIEAGGSASRTALELLDEIIEPKKLFFSNSKTPETPLFRRGPEHRRVYAFIVGALLRSLEGRECDGWVMSHASSDGEERWSLERIKLSK